MGTAQNIIKEMDRCQRSYNEFYEIVQKAIDESDRGLMNEIYAGTRVEVVGLTSMPEMNGRSGELVSWHTNLGRWKVSVEGCAELIRLKPENIVVKQAELTVL